MRSVVISPEELEGLLKLPKSAAAQLVLLDARTGPGARAAYERAHLPGARFVDLETDLASHEASTGDAARDIHGRHPLPSPAAFAATLGRLGVQPMSPVVVYDTSGGGNAASRAWWMLRALGHTNVRVLEGTPETFAAAGLVMTDAPSEWDTCRPYPTAAYGLPTVDADFVEMVRTDPSFIIIDARSGARFRGEQEPIDPVAGHIPGAVNLFHMDLVDETGRFRAPADIESRVKSVIGEHPMHRVVVHCGSGVTACHVMLAMSHAGLGIPALYVGSWSEWCRNERPIATGPA
jgi:thiosulfate/3-mercaptopyruvate sulfurtransferase